MERQLTAAGSPERAEREAAYLKGDLHHLGVAVPAVELLVLHAEQLRPDDVALLEHLLREARTWALVDPLASGPVGLPRDHHAEDLEPVLRRWATDDDVWIRRSALLAHLVARREGRGDWDGFCELADLLLADREFFVRKAIGWVLRDTGRHRPEIVADWLSPRAHRGRGPDRPRGGQAPAPREPGQILAARD